MFLVDGLWNAFRMAWEVWWALVLGFPLSAIVQAWVPRRAAAARARRPGLRTGRARDRPRRRIVVVQLRGGRDREVAVPEGRELRLGDGRSSSRRRTSSSSSGSCIWIFLGWQFTLAEFVGGIVLIALMWLGLRLFVTRRLEEEAREHARGRAGRPPARDSARVGCAQAALGRSLVGRRAQLPRRLGDALEGDHRPAS